MRTEMRIDRFASASQEFGSMIQKNELQIDLWRWKDGGRSMRITHINTEISVFRDVSKDESVYKVSQELKQELSDKITKRRL